MIEMLPKLIEILKGVVEDPDTYKKIEGARQILEKLTGKKIDRIGLVALVEGVTQGAPYTGKWEEISEESWRLRTDNGWIYHVQGSNLLFVPD